VNIDKRFISIALASAFIVAACSGAGTTPVPSQATPSQPTTSADAPSDEPSMGTEPTDEESAGPEPTDEESMEPEPSDGEPGEDLSGDIVISGSSTVGPISTGVSEMFSEQYPNVAISVDEPGTGDGFALFCNDEIDIADASRAIEDDEAKACADAGIDYLELSIGLDGIGVITSINNDPALTCLTFADLYALTGPESTGFSTWAAAQDLATELGSSTTLPDAPFTLTAPGEESGTYDFFVEAVIEPIAEERGLAEEEWAARPDYQSSPDDNVIIEGVAGTAENASTLGWVGFAFVENALDRVRALEVDGGEGCVEPNIETIGSGDYPISRPLFIYVNTERAAANEALAAYVDFYLSDGVISEVFQLPTAAYVELPEEEFSATREIWENR
jgi:phosphate transport system substrate-binding protein